MRPHRHEDLELQPTWWEKQGTSRNKKHGRLSGKQLQTNLVKNSLGTTLDQIHTRTVAARRTTKNAHSSGGKKGQQIASCDKSFADPTLVFFFRSLSLSLNHAFPMRSKTCKHKQTQVATENPPKKKPHAHTNRDKHQRKCLSTQQQETTCI